MRLANNTAARVRRSIAGRRAARAMRSRIQRELAEYRTPGERDQLYAILARHSAEDRAPVDRVLTRQPDSWTARHHTRTL